MFFSLSIADVLLRSPQASFDFSIFIVSLLALSLATLSAAKGYELVKRRQPLDPTIEIQAEEIAELKEQLSKLTFDLGEVTRAEQLLRKSNISLSRECERLTKKKRGKVK